MFVYQSSLMYLMFVWTLNFQCSWENLLRCLSSHAYQAGSFQQLQRLIPNYTLSAIWTADNLSLSIMPHDIECLFNFQNH